MKYLLLVPLLALASCGGSLSDEQRKQIKEGIEMQKIVKVSDSEIMTEALDKGKAVFSELEKSGFESRLDSLGASQKVVIRFITPGPGNGRAIEQELIDAYINDIAGAGLPENIQKVWTSDQKEDYDSLLYTRPQVEKRPDGVEELKGIWSIYMARKDVVIAISRRK